MAKTINKNIKINSLPRKYKKIYEIYCFNCMGYFTVFYSHADKISMRIYFPFKNDF